MIVAVFLVLGGLLYSAFALQLNYVFSLKFRWVDRPKSRGVSVKEVPILGHSLALTVSVLSVILCFMADVSWFFPLSVISLSLVGGLDDITPLGALPKLILQIVCCGLFISTFNGPQGISWLPLILLTLFATLAINAINFTDGINGMAALVLIALGVGSLVLTAPRWGYQEFAITFVVVSLGVFFVYNVFLSKGFLGNVGSYSVGGFLVLSQFIFPSSFIPQVTVSNILPFLGILSLMMIVPLADFGFVFVFRLMSRRSPFRSDKGHLHHRLLQANLSLAQVLSCFGTFSLVSLGLLWYFSSDNLFLYSLAPLVVSLSLACLISMTVGLVELSSRRRMTKLFRGLNQGCNVLYVRLHVQSYTKTIRSQLLSLIVTQVRVNDVVYKKGDDLVIIFDNLKKSDLTHVLLRVGKSLEEYGVKYTVAESGEYVKVSHPNTSYVEKNIGVQTENSQAA